MKICSADEFLNLVANGLSDTRPVNVRDATQAVFVRLNHYVSPDQIENVRAALPEQIRALWPPNGSRERGRFEPAA